MLRSISDKIYTAISWIAVAMFSVLIVIFFGQIVARYVFQSSFVWGDELSRYLFVWIMFLGISMGIYHSAHIGITFFQNKLSDSARKILNLLLNALILLFFALVGYLGLKFCLINMDSITPVLELRYGIVYSVIPISSLLSVLFSLTVIVDSSGGSK